MTRRKRKDYLPYYRPSIGKEEKKEVSEVLNSGWLSTGPKTELFEERVRNYVKAKFAVALNSCTAALHLGLVAIGVKSGDEVITSPYTFAATGNTIVLQGAKPVFADIEPGTLNINPEEISKKITSRTKAIMPVHFAGQSCRMDEIMAIAKKHKLFVIDDAAHALGSEYKGKKIGSISDMTCLSFYVTKNITTAEGGMLTTDNEKIAEQVRVLSLHGLSQNAWKRYLEKAYRPYEVVRLGYKYNLSDLQSAVGLGQLKKIEKFWKIRKRITAIYNNAFRDIPEITLLKEIKSIKHSYHLYVILLNIEKLNIRRDEFVVALRDENIGTSVHFQSLHLQKYYRQRYGFKSLDFPEAYFASQRCLSLPLYTKMTGEDIADVIDAVKRVLSKHKKKNLL